MQRYQKVVDYNVVENFMLIIFVVDNFSIAPPTLEVLEAKKFAARFQPE